MNWKSGMVFMVGTLLIAGSFFFSNRETVQGQGTIKGSSHYSVISTDGAHLIVTDNAINKLYFYAIDKEGKIGDELKLRGSLDLHDVGKPSLKPIDAKPQR